MSIGAIIYYIVMQVVLWLGLPTNYLKLLTALVVAMFLAVPHWKSQLFTARSARKGEKQDARNQSYCKDHQSRLDYREAGIGGW